jgi:hypothetical protein
MFRSRMSSSAPAVTHVNDVNFDDLLDDSSDDHLDSKRTLPEPDVTPTNETAPQIEMMCTSSKSLHALNIPIPATAVPLAVAVQVSRLADRVDRKSSSTSKAPAPSGPPPPMLNMCPEALAFRDLHRLMSLQDLGDFTSRVRSLLKS